ncbi:MAG TPA: Stk1 family PASTA domain-containing Ser/Thr kinase [Jatrophihabitans sp.]|nr:Stk1 family PASTA domain-containing Ser/Thr kinase [Jatrophihabitans sp.]
MQTAATDTLVGRSLEGRYRILERIARGGMSTVYAAVDERLDRLVAVKVMSAALSADPAFSDRFAREARAAARLTHLNVVSVYDQGHELAPDGHHVFLVMELVEGRTLRELLRERGRLEPAQAISIMEPVLSALSAAHRAGLVHRDVKPENILLSDDGVVKVADFGLARAVESDASSTRTGLMMGTVAYCAPEQISKGSSDPRSDVYSAGVVLFELLTGTPPYHGDSAMNVAYQHVHSRVPAPSSRVKGVPEEIDELVVAATDSDPTGRPADAGAFLAEIAELRTTLQLPVVPVPPRPRPAGRTLRPELQYRTPDSATTDLIRRDGGAGNDTALVPGRTAPNGRRPVPRDENAPPPPVVIPPPKQRRQVPAAKRRRRRAIIALVVILLLGAAAGYAGWWFASGRYSHIPDLTNDSQAAAISALQQAGYKYRIVEPGSDSYSNTIQKGLVLRTSPGAHARLVRGKTVLVYLSAGPHYYTIPSVQSGQTPDQMRAALEAVGPLRVAQQVKQEASDTVPDGDVTRTVPKAGTRVTSEQTITIYVSTGPPILDIPSIPQGTSWGQAKQQLSTAGFKPKRTDEYSDQIGKDQVIACQTGQARKFSAVTCTVSKGAQMVAVPKIQRRESSEEASAALQAVGLVPQLDTSFDGGVLDEVVSVDPQPGTLVKVGSTVVLTVV